MRRHIDAVAESEQPSHHHEDGDAAEKSPHAEAARTHGGNFAIRGKAAKSDEDANQHSHRNGVGERYRNSIEKDLRHARQRSAVADHKFEYAAEITGEKDKGENRRADQGVGDNFSQNVAREDAHPQKY